MPRPPALGATTRSRTLTNVSVLPFAATIGGRILARVAELADAQPSGGCVRKDVGVQVPPRAQHFCEVPGPSRGFPSLLGQVRLLPRLQLLKNFVDVVAVGLVVRELAQHVTHRARVRHCRVDEAGADATCEPLGLRGCDACQNPAEHE